MLSDRERETLCEIEQNLRDEDPKLVEALKDAEWPAERHRHAFTGLLVVAALLGVFALALGHMSGALACALLAGWAWGALRLRTRP